MDRGEKSTAQIQDSQKQTRWTRTEMADLHATRRGSSVQTSLAAGRLSSEAREHFRSLWNVNTESDGVIICSVWLLMVRERREKKINQTNKQTVFLVLLTLSRFALAGCLAYAGCDKGCHGGGVGIRWVGTDCSCCQDSGLEDLAWAQAWKWQPSVARRPNTRGKWSG